MTSKADYVRSQPSDGQHTCHWPGCNAIVPPAMWGCRTHWYTLPRHLRRRIWDTYRPGQEKDKSPSSDYICAANEVQAWILKKGPVV